MTSSMLDVQTQRHCSKATHRHFNTTNRQTGQNTCFGRYDSTDTAKITQMGTVEAYAEDAAIFHRATCMRCMATYRPLQHVEHTQPEPRRTLNYTDSLQYIRILYCFSSVAKTSIENNNANVL